MAERAVKSRTVAYAATDEELFREQMRTSAHGDGAHPRTFAYLLVKAAETRVWEKLAGPTGEPFRTFRDFLTAADPDGLGMTVEELRHAVALAGDEAQQAVDRLLKGETSRASMRGNKTKRTTLNNIDESLGPQSETAERHLRRLKRDDPALAEQVVNGELSSYAAARSKGWKPPRIQVTTPERTAAHLRKYLTQEQRAELARLLIDNE